MILEDVEHVEVRVLKQIDARVVVIWGDPACVHAEERAKLIVKELFLCSCSRLCRYPEIFLLSLYIIEILK